MSDILSIKLNGRMRLALSIIGIVSALAALIGTGYALQARVGALEVADVVSVQRVQTIEAGSVERDMRIEKAQDRTGLIVVENQRALAAIDAKIDILLSDRDRRTAP